MASFDKNILKVVDEMFNLTDKEHREILKMYKQSRDNIKQFIANVFMQYGQDGKIDYAEFERLHIREVEDFLQQQANEIAQEETSLIPLILSGVLTNTYFKTAYYLEQSFEVGISFDLLRQEFIDEVINFNWSGVPFSERIWDNQNSLIKNLITQLAQGLMEGESIDKIARRINKIFDSKAYESQRLIHTESARVISVAQEQIYKDTGIVKEVEWVATLETNTCDECARLDGQRFKLDNPNKPKLPRHPNCRCTYIAIPFKDYQVRTRKDNETKEFVEASTYEEWAKQKGIPFN